MNKTKLTFSEKKIKIKNTTSNGNENGNSSSKKETKNPSTLPYDIWQHIFRFLSAKDLCVTLQVCKAWNELTHREMSMRGPHLLITKPTWIRDCEKIISQINVIPKLVICFIESDKIFSLRRKDCLSDFLPKNCKTLYMTTLDVDVNTTKTKVLETTEKAGLIIFPNSLYTTILRGQRAVFRENSFGVVQELLNCSCSESRCLIMLSSFIISSLYYTKVLMEVLRKQNIKEFSLICLVTDELFNYEKALPESNNIVEKKEEDLILISVHKPSMRSWSLQIPEKCVSEEALIASLDELKSKIKLKKISCAIMFSTENRIRRKKLEISAFEKVFPNIPLMSVYGKQTFGVNTIHSDLDPSFESIPTKFYRTLFMIITYDRV